MRLLLWITHRNPDGHQQQADIAQKLHERAQAYPDDPILGPLHVERERYNRVLDDVTNVNVTELRHFVNACDQALKKVTNRCRTDDAEEWRQQVEQMVDPTKGMTKGHSFTRGYDRAPPLPTKLVTQNGTLTHPRQLGEHYMHEWNAFWNQRTQDEYLEVFNKLRRVIRVARSRERLAFITADDIYRGIQGISIMTALGIDQWSPEELKALP